MTPYRVNAANNLDVGHESSLGKAPLYRESMAVISQFLRSAPPTVLHNRLVVQDLASLRSTNLSIARHNLKTGSTTFGSDGHANAAKCQPLFPTPVTAQPRGCES